ncbi:MAG: hypothetical protein OEZ10_08795 [Gammaproteobacteria bacterium]|nr:hypothetical protein [Gammaproteobacteria bacterium]
MSARQDQSISVEQLDAFLTDQADDLGMSRPRLGELLLVEARSLLDIPADLAGRLVTDIHLNTYVDDKAWQVSSDPAIGTLIDAANLLRSGEFIKV